MTSNSTDPALQKFFVSLSDEFEEASTNRSNRELVPEGQRRCPICGELMISAHEKAVLAALEKLPNRPFISISSRVLPEFREYERTSTVVVNSYVGQSDTHRRNEQSRGKWNRRSLAI